MRNFATDMANVENVEEMVGTREAEAAAVATESGGAVATESGGDETCDKTAGDERDGGDRWGNVYGRRGVRI